ncbi:MAG: AAA family ATPase [Chloroflexia bacterium]|nr:AAA family ATPase [Chloroflexia bacterium]
MEKTEIKKTIVSQQEYLDKEVAVSRTKLEEVLSHQDNAFVIILSGVRRAGKSTLLNIVRKRRKENNIINFDDNRLTGFKINDFENLYESFIELFGEENTFYFDEIQNINGWEIFVRRLHNERRKVFITGSNAHLLSRELGTHLTGRNIRIELFPFSFKEYLDLINYQYSKKDFYSTVNHR